MFQKKKKTLDISIDNKHQSIENAERAISEFIKSRMTNNIFVKLCVKQAVTKNLS
ncbi:hypothetical protein HET73_05115 [Wolbachia endosymbiont of Atemnus politus]|uniref:hypothetical protein n=1 Tax=Wolbachia endosymbiont of Atemnus politus TaxID=2682840 RepID=UPI001573B516|nr:hypothetical protein [Wolbachia endosymbiont of Atemnus politus]NSM56777.1 hypothetical protein [Wolbachia endosymbiont of Atemnus politus]NSX83761.1 hypothetical protein [Wolbachia endosymbiont of Atemnus politus]